MQTCEYGCRLEAVHQFKSSGKWCCSSNVNSCPGKRKTDSEKKKGKSDYFKLDNCPFRLLITSISVASTWFNSER